MRTRNSGIGAVIVAVGIVIGFLWFVFGETVSQFLIVPAIGVALVGLVRLAMANAMPRKTDFGAEESEKWRAFRRYLENIQKYTGVAQAAAKFQQYLPYAVAMGVDQQYIRQFTNVPANAASRNANLVYTIGLEPAICTATWAIRAKHRRTCRTSAHGRRRQLRYWWRDAGHE